MFVLPLLNTNVFNTVPGRSMFSAMQDYNGGGAMAEEPIIDTFNSGGMKH